MAGYIKIPLLFATLLVCGNASPFTGQNQFVKRAGSFETASIESIGSIPNSYESIGVPSSVESVGTIPSQGSTESIGVPSSIESIGTIPGSSESVGVPSSIESIGTIPGSSESVGIPSSIESIGTIPSSGSTESVGVPSSVESIGSPPSSVESVGSPPSSVESVGTPPSSTESVGPPPPPSPPGRPKPPSGGRPKPPPPGKPKPPSGGKPKPPSGGKPKPPNRYNPLYNGAEVVERLPTVSVPKATLVLKKSLNIGNRDREDGENWLRMVMKSLWDGMYLDGSFKVEKKGSRIKRCIILRRPHDRYRLFKVNHCFELNDTERTDAIRSMLREGRP